MNVKKLKVQRIKARLAQARMSDGSYPKGTFAAIAGETGVTRAYVSMIANGKRGAGVE